jgi:hypothetical protein
MILRGNEARGPNMKAPTQIRRSRLSHLQAPPTTDVFTNGRVEFFVDSSKARLSVKSYNPGLSIPYTASQSNERRKCGFHPGSS